jgi:hypothetical protein
MVQRYVITQNIFDSLSLCSVRTCSVLFFLFEGTRNYKEGRLEKEKRSSSTRDCSSTRHCSSAKIFILVLLCP